MTFYIINTTFSLHPSPIDPVANKTLMTSERHTHIESIKVRLLVYLIPVLCVLAFVNNGTIIGVAIGSKRFRKELFPSVRLLYATLAVFDIFGVITYQLVEWLGTSSNIIYLYLESTLKFRISTRHQKLEMGRDFRNRLPLRLYLYLKYLPKNIINIK